MIEKQTVDLATQKQLMKYAEDLVKLQHELKKERELLSKANRKEFKIRIESITKKHIFSSVYEFKLELWISILSAQLVLLILNFI